MANLSARILRTLDELTPLVPAWRRLAGPMPFGDPLWLLTWWRHYGNGGGSAAGHLFVVVVESEGEPIGIAPFYLERSFSWGGIVRPLGSGETCTDYVGLFAAPGREAEVAAIAAQHLSTVAKHEWDRIEFDVASMTDATLILFANRLQRHGAETERRPSPSCWRLPLPNDFDAYLARLSHSHRKLVRRLVRNVLDTDRARWHTVGTHDELKVAWPILIDLHQRRRRSLGETGRFASQRFAAFHREAAGRLLEQGQLRLHWLELDGRPIAAEYCLAADGVVYAYQSGVDPERLDEEPGRLAGIAAIRQAIADGFRVYDFLRGDEPYKAHWRAEPLPTENLTIVSPRAVSRARHKVRAALREIKRRMTAADSARPASCGGDA